MTPVDIAANCMDQAPAEYFGGPVVANLFSDHFDLRVLPETGAPYDFAICIDVLEHLHYDTLDKALDNIRAVSRHGVLIPACYASAYHLHPIVETPAWWAEKIREYFPDADCYLESRYCVARY